jgi:leucyl-tRNA synthetase
MATSKGTSTAAATAETTEKRSTAKLDTIREIEKQMQKLWADLKVFEVDAPGHTTDK